MSSPPVTDPILTPPPTASQGLHLQIDFSYRKFQNLVSEKSNDTLTPLYIQQFGLLKPQLKYDAIPPNGPLSQIGTGTIMNVSISAECTLENTIHLSRAFSPSNNNESNGNGTRVPITWLTESSFKRWDFVCVNSATQEPIAKMSVNWWALKQVGNIYFEKTKEELDKRQRDEVVVTGLTLLYVMISRMNNPLNLVGSFVAKPGRVEGGEAEEEHSKAKRL